MLRRRGFSPRSSQVAHDPRGRRIPARCGGARTALSAREPSHWSACRPRCRRLCCGGGGIPVVRDQLGAFHGVDAVLEKDLTAAILAKDLGADALVFLTDAPGVWSDWGTPNAKLSVLGSPRAATSPRPGVHVDGSKAGGCLSVRRMDGPGCLYWSHREARGGNGWPNGHANLPRRLGSGTRGRERHGLPVT